jgi:transcriptional regulator with XRE-family HTH domain
MVKEQRQEISTWQEFLGQLIDDIQTRERLATAVHVRPITLQRWASGSSKPRPENLRALLKILPADNYTLFIHLLARDFPDLLADDPTLEQIHQDLPPEFYARVLSALALTSLSMCRQTVQDLIFHQALEQLDPERHGLSISLVCCVPPRQGEKVRSLREVGGVGTPPWPSDLVQKTMFLGAESLVGHSISDFRSCVINSRDEKTFFPANWTAHEQSVAAFPISRSTRLAGGLLISSARPHFFTQPRVSLLEQYSYLATLIFEANEFYEPALLDLRMMPSEELQAPYFRDFQRRVSRKLADALHAHQQISLQEAYQQIWQDLEEELFQVFLQMDLPGSMP